MAIAEVGSGSQRQPVRGTGVDSATAAYPANVTAGNLLTLQFGGWSPTSEDTSVAVTDTRGTTWTVLLPATPNYVAYASGQAKPAIAYGIAPSSGACTVTVNPSGTGDYFNGVIDEWSGVDTTTPLDVDGSFSFDTTAAPSDSLTTVTDNALVLGVLIISSGGSVTIAPGSGYTQQDEDETASRQVYSAIFQIVGIAGVYSPNWTVSVTGALVYTAAFKASVGAPAAGAVKLVGDRFRLAGSGGGLAGRSV